MLFVLIGDDTASADVSVIIKMNNPTPMTLTPFVRFKIIMTILIGKGKRKFLVRTNRRNHSFLIQRLNLNL
jgi:hypothetical protein